METRTLAGARHASIRLTSTQATEFIDLTDHLERLIAEARVRFGILNVQALHTTTAVVINEHEPLLLADFQALLEHTAPADGPYRHDDPTTRTVNVTPEERRNGHAHCRALFLPSAVCLNVANGRLRLGRWQRVFLVELDGPREREVSAFILGACPRRAPHAPSRPASPANPNDSKNGQARSALLGGRS